MPSEDPLQTHENRPIRTVWDEERGEWYFPVADVSAALTDQPTYDSVRNDWRVLKSRLKSEGANELVTNCIQLKSA